MNDVFSDKYQLSPVLWWDVDKKETDSRAGWIAERVVEMGTLDDFRKILAYFGHERVKELLLQSTRLSARDLYFCSVYFEVDESQFACSTKKSSSPKPLRYWNP
jgi:hypothetical protein